MRDTMTQDNQEEDEGADSLQAQLQQLSDEKLLAVTRRHREVRKAQPRNRQVANEYRACVVECARRGLKP